jgi:valyl-tRNA synthetase
MSVNYSLGIVEKTWNPALEADISQKWKDEGVFKFHKRHRRGIFTIDTPPPYPSGRPWHIGAAAHYSQIDMITRASRMMGYEVSFPIGIDRNGLPVELYTEKKYGISLRNTPRKEFIEMCKHALDDLESEMIEIMKKMGLSGNFTDYYRTDSDKYRSSTQATFIHLWNKGLIYEATRPNNYCPDCKTTIADAEVDYEELVTRLIYIQFKVRETGEFIVIATTRPELLCSCQIILVNPEDIRHVKYQGLHVEIPIYCRDVEIKPHSSVQPEFGSGAVMMCSYGDYTDVLLFREMKLKEIIAIDEDGKMSTIAGKYAGLRVSEARARILDDLTNDGLVVKIEEIRHRTPTCERSHTPIEIIPMKEFYLKQIQFLPKLRKLVEGMDFHPEVHRQILVNWMNSMTLDWPISRRRYYATEIPVWYCQKCGEPHVPKAGHYYRPWLDSPPFKSCQRCGNSKFKADERTFDTWMDSSITPLFVTGYFDNKSLYTKTYPTSLRPQAKDIIRTWLFYTILRCYQLTGKAPFKHVWIMGYGVDEKGERMSKSKGNVIDPYPILKKYGADIFRLWAASEASLGSDFRCSEPRISGAGKFLTKLWNIARFISNFPRPRRVKLECADMWILAELSILVKVCLEGYKDYNFFVPSNRIREFTWNTFAAHYLEMAKARAYRVGFSKEEQKAAWYTLHTCFETILILLSPITPFITEHLWERLYSHESIHTQSFPKSRWSVDLSRLTKDLIEFNSKVWNTKKSRGLSLKEQISLHIPEELKPFEKDLVAMHNIIQEQKIIK